MPGMKTIAFTLEAPRVFAGAITRALPPLSFGDNNYLGEARPVGEPNWRKGREGADAVTASPTPYQKVERNYALRKPTTKPSASMG
jgi:hypothetical protein